METAKQEHSIVCLNLLKELNYYVKQIVFHLFTIKKIVIFFHLSINLCRRYEAEARYLCVPSREDVYKLLVGLHENRNGNHHKTIQFCNRKRPAKAVFTNIRFLG